VAPKKILLEEKEKGRCFMKKLMLILVALVVAPAMAQVTFEGTYADGVVTISYTTDGEQPRGLALNLASDDGVSMDSLVAESFSCFNVFLDYAFANSEGYAVGDGDPIADPAGPGVGSLPNTEISICMGFLDEDGIEPKGDPGPDACASVVALNVSGTGTIVVTADTLRGPDSGVVGSELASNLPITIIVDGVEPTCYDRLTAAEQVVWDSFIAAGKTVAQMECWCNQFQCRGDADNAAYLPGVLNWQIYSADLTAMVNNWKSTYITNTNPCSDFDHATYLPGVLNWTVYSGDLTILVQNWKAVTSTLTDCPAYVAP
jgi:hypothetical protein